MDVLDLQKIISSLSSETIDIPANENAQTYLHLAAEAGDHETVKRLLNQGANIHCKDHKGQTPLHKAARTNEESIVIQMLVDAGKIIDARDNFGFTALHLAVIHGLPNVVATLVQNGADLTIKATSSNYERMDAHHICLHQIALRKEGPTPNPYIQVKAILEGAIQGSLRR